MENMKKGIILGSMVIVLVILGIVFFDKSNEIKEKKFQTIKINDIFLNVEIADTDKERIKGLSGRKNLEENKGLLFVFDTEGYHGIWMKEMNFNIDIAWLDKNKKIIHIEKNVSPNTYPKDFYSFDKDKPTLDLYVLETNANFFEKADIEVEDLAEF